MENKRNVFDFVLYVRGVYGRNRKEKFTSVRLFRCASDAALPDAATIEKAAAGARDALNVKSGRWYVDRNPVELTTYSDGVTIESFVLHSGERVLSGMV